MVLIATILQSTLNARLPLDLQYIFFYLSTQSEQQLRATEAGELHLTLIDSVRFKSDLSMATRNHRLALIMSQEFWQRVCLEYQYTRSSGKHSGYFVNAEGRVLGLVARVCDDFYEHCRAADFYYMKLLDKFPTSDLVAERYAMFLANVMNDEKASNDVTHSLEVAKKERKKYMNGSNMQSMDGVGTSRLSGSLDFEYVKKKTPGTFSGSRSFQSHLVIILDSLSRVRSWLTLYMSKSIVKCLGWQRP
jgi:hypothetical protein